MRFRVFWESENGNAAILATMLLPVLIGITAFGVDASRLYRTDAELQDAADSAAYAAAHKLQKKQSVIKDTALDHAAAAMTEDVLNTSDIKIGYWHRIDETFSEGRPPDDEDVAPAVKVTTKRAEANGNPVELTFASIMGFDSTDLSETAIAIRSSHNSNKQDSQACAFTQPPGKGAKKGSSGKLHTIKQTGDYPTSWKPENVEALGPASAADFNNNGSPDVAYAKNNNKIHITDQDEQPKTRKINISNNKIDIQKTALTVSNWQGSEPAIFYTGKDHDSIYSVRPGGQSREIADPGNGVNMVTGAGDVDQDGERELIFADASQTPRYIEPGEAGSGNFKSLANGNITAGSNQNVGLGAPTLFKDLSQTLVPVVDGSNQIVLLNDNFTEETLITGSDDEEAAKGPVCSTDIDDDDSKEVIYIESSSSHLKYIDDVGGANIFKYVRDGSGRKIIADKKRGVVSPAVGGGEIMLVK